MKRRFIHPAKVLFVHEGNLFDVLVDLGFKITVKVPVVLSGFDLPSLRSSSSTERELARAAKECAMKLLLNRWCLVETYKEDVRTGAYPADIYLAAPTKYRDTITEVDGEEYINVRSYMVVLHPKGFPLDALDVPAQA